MKEREMMRIARDARDARDSGCEDAYNLIISLIGQVKALAGEEYSSEDLSGEELEVKRRAFKENV